MGYSMKYLNEVRPGEIWYRRNGVRWERLPGKPDSVEFLEAYTRIHATFERPSPSPAVPGTFESMVRSYLTSGEFAINLKTKTQSAYRLDLDVLRKAFGPFRPADITVAHVLKLRDKLSGKPGMANTAMRTLRVVFSWGIVRGLAKNNPADLSSLGVKAMKLGEHQPWTPDALERFRQDGAPHLVLAMEMALWLGQRQGDLIRIRWSDIRDGMIVVCQEKTGKDVWLPVAQPLMNILARAPKSAVTVLVNSKGVPWRTSNVLAQAFGAELRRLKLGGLVFHGLRKTTAVVLAEAGCTVKQIAAITGQSDQMVSHYTKGVNRLDLARAAVTKMERKANSSGGRVTRTPGSSDTDH